MKKSSTCIFRRSLKPLLLSVALLCVSLVRAQNITVTATAGAPGPVSYATLGDAFTEINNGTYKGDVTIKVTGNTIETTTAQLNASGSGSASYTSVLIKPDVGVTATINSALINSCPVYLYGASNVTIDGSNTLSGTSKDLTINNTSPGCAIRLGTPSASVACTDIVIKNCVLTGGSPSANTAVIVSDGGTTMGGAQLAPTNNITIQNNTISGMNKGILTNGPAALNTNLVIADNNISDCRTTGIELTREKDADISHDTISGPQLGIQLSNGDNVTISNNRVIGVVVTGVVSSSASPLNFSGIQIINGTVIALTSNRISGPSVSGGSATYTTLTSGGTFSGVSVSGGSGIGISGNIISGPTGVLVNNTPTAGVHFLGNAKSVELKGNSISGVTNDGASGAYGVYIDVTSTASDITVYNNFISRINGTPGTGVAQTGQGIYVAKADGLGIFFNSISMNVDQTGATGGSPGSAGICFNPVAPGDITTASVKMQDNIMVNRQTTGVPYALYCAAPVGIFSAIDYNDYYTATGNMAFDGSTGINTILGMQGAFSGDINSITFNPQWVSAADLHLLTIPANAPLNAGVNIISPSITTDVDGAARTVPTIGADELVICTLDTIAGVTNMCFPGTTTLSNTVAGGTWSSGNSAIATIDPAGVVTSVAAGVAIISYTDATCSVTTTVTVGTLPIGGPSAVCIGGNVQLSNGTPGGVWSSDNTLAATVDPATGVVYGVSGTSVNISYTAGSCPAVGKAITVNAPPTAIAAGSSICAGSMFTLSSSPGGGTWSSDNTAIATVSATGDVSGVAPGTAHIDYLLNSCTVTETVTVTAPLSPITGSTALCTGQVSTLSNVVGSGTWSSSNTGIATINGTGDISAVATGTVTITYATGGCTTVTTVTVSIPPAPISGATSVCAGSSITLSDAVAGGNWSSDNTAVATISSVGDITTTGPGTTLISYTIGSCAETYSVTVDAGLPPITGITIFCAGDQTHLNNATAGGTWSSGNTVVATVLPGTGDVTGVSAGNAGIIYTRGACSVTTTVTVSTPPGAISGPTDVCESSTITLSDPTPGGFWDTDDPSIAVVSGAGDVTGISAGTVIIDYSDGTCIATTTITVSPALGPITGTTAICVGSSSSLNNSTFGGTWSSSNTTVATIDASGFVTTLTAGTTTINYVVGACTASTIVTVSNPPPAITGPASVCVGSTITLNNTTPGGAWSSSNNTIATVTNTGVVGGGTAGLVTISYTVGGCVVGTPITVSTPLPAITGPGTVCVGSTITLSNPVPGGTWSSDNNSVATVSGSGVVSGVASGTANITYAGGGCFVSVPVTVNASSAGTISGQDSICIGGGHEVTLTSTITGGVWSSSNNARAVVNASGVVTGVSTGTFTITYTVTSSCGTFTATYAMYVRSASKCATGISPNTGNQENELQVFPNPNEGRFTVNLLSDIDEQVNIIITNVIGAKVREYSGVTNKVVDIQLDPVPGIYIITASTEHGKYVRKVVIR